MSPHLCAARTMYGLVFCVYRSDSQHTLHFWGFATVRFVTPWTVYVCVCVCVRVWRVAEC